MAKSKYAELLQHPLWQRKRLEIMARDFFECRICKAKDDTLHVHHRHYLPNRQPWDYPHELLVTLCKNCHAKEEQAVATADDIFKALHFWGYFNTEILAEVNKLIEIKMNAIKSTNTHAEPNVKGLDGK